jgi:hypothetical protein
VNASEHAPPELTDDASLFPSQPLHVEALRRPIESTQPTPTEVVHAEDRSNRKH